MTAKILVVRHAPYAKYGNNGLKAEVLTRGGVKAAQGFLQKLQAVISEYNALHSRVYSSPSPRAVQTAAIVTGEEHIVLSQDIDESYMGFRAFVGQVKEIVDLFELIVIVTHAPAVGKIAAELVGDEYEEGSVYDYRTIDYCSGFLIVDGKITKI